MELIDNEQQRWEEIDAYLRNELTAGQRTAVESRVGNDAAFAADVERIRVAKTAVKEYARHEDMKAIHRKMTSGPKAISGRWTDGVGFYLRIAAIFVVLLAAWATIGITTLSPGSLYADEYSAYSAETIRAESPQLPSTAHRIQVEYLNANYLGVVQLYRQSTAKTVRESFIAGNAYLALGQAANASVCFKKVLLSSASENAFDFYQSSEYYLAWSYLKNNQFKQAMPLFEKIYRNRFHLHNGDVDTWFYWKLKLLQWKQG